MVGEDQILKEMTKDLRTTTVTDGKEVRRKQKLIRNRRRALKNSYYKELADNINITQQRPGKLRRNSLLLRNIVHSGKASIKPSQMKN